MDAYVLSLKPNRPPEKKKSKTLKKRPQVKVQQKSNDVSSPHPVDVMSPVKPSLLKRNLLGDSGDALADDSQEQITDTQTVSSLEEIYERKLIQRRKLKREIDQIMAEIIVLQKQNQIITDALDQLNPSNE